MMLGDRCCCPVPRGDLCCHGLRQRLLPNAQSNKDADSLNKLLGLHVSDLNIIG